MPIFALGLLFGSLLQMQQARLWQTERYVLLCVLSLVLLVATTAIGLRLRRQVNSQSHNLAPVLSARRAEKQPLNLIRVSLLLTAAVSLAYGAAGWRATHRLADRLAPQLWGQVVSVEGVVLSLPVRRSDSTRFVFMPLHAAAGMPERILVSWHAARAHDRARFQVSDGGKLHATVESASAPVVHPGEVWRLPLRLKPVHGAANPAGFDAELWLFEQGIGATATVSAARRYTPPVSLGHLAGSIELALESLRDALRGRIDTALSGNPQAGVIAALALGDQAAIPSRDWAVYRITGVAHLMSISGLHITMLAWLAASLAAALWRRSAQFRRPGPLWLPAPTVAAWGGLLAATCYSAIAGFGVPAQRTLLMLAAGFLLRMSGLRFSWTQTLAWALAAVLLWDPWAVLQAGFWLSFCAVGILFLSDHGEPGVSDTALVAAPQSGVAARLRARALGVRSALLRAGRAQWVVTLALAPLTLLFFQQIAVLSPLANAVAIPVVTFFVAPLAVFGLVLPAPLDGWIWHAAAVAQAQLSWLLAQMATWPQAQWHAALPGWPTLCLAALGVLALILPWPWRLRVPGLVLLMPLLSNPGERPQERHVEAWLADVGQGMAIVVRTARHTLLFDAGPRLGPNTDAGERVLLPLLHALGERRLDLVVLSHADMDHVGGAETLAHAYPGTPALGSVPPAQVLAWGYAQARPCVAGMHWVWDGVVFTVLHPDADATFSPRQTNARSCVLRVAGAGGAVLLTGDIERAQERQLANGSDAGMLKADLLIAPHHGSKSSSSAEFLQAVGPSQIAIQVGFMNSYGHPHEDVMKRYVDLGTGVRRTDQDGALVWRDTSPADLHAWRESQPHYWQLHWPSTSDRQPATQASAASMATADGPDTFTRPY